MKTVVVDIKDGFAAVLSQDGSITKITDKGYMIGQVIKMKDNKIYKAKKFIASAAAIAVVAVTGGIGAWAYNTPYTYVSLDVNPSIEFSVNRFDQVIDVTAVNDDGEDILNEINADNLNNQPIEEAIIETVNQISENGYFDGTDEGVVSGGGIVISTSSEDEEKADELAGELQEAVEGQVHENGEAVEVEAISVGLERVQQAKKLGVTPGKLNLVQKLQASAADPDSIILEEWLNKSVKEIMKATKENKKAAKLSKDTAEEVEDTENTEGIVETIDEEQATDNEVAIATETSTKAEKKEAKVKETKAKAEEKAKEEKTKAEVKVKEANVKAEEKAKAKEKAEAKVKEAKANAEEKAKEEKTKAEEKVKEEKAKAEEKVKEAKAKAEEKAKEEKDKNESNSKSSNNNSSKNSNNEKSKK